MTSNFKTIAMGVRPARVAVLVDGSDSRWESTIMRVLEFYGRLWGGAYNFVVPTDGKVIDPVFWEMLEAFDPDYLFAYQRTWADIEREDSEKFEAEAAKHVENWLRQIPGSDPDDARRQIMEQMRNVAMSAFAIEDPLQQLLKRRLSPMYFKNWIVSAGRLHADAKGDHHLTQLKEILPYTNHPRRIAIIDDVSKTTSELWRAAAFGAVQPSHIEELAQLGVTPNRVTYDDKTISNLIRLALRGRVDTGWNLAFGTALGENVEISDELPSKLTMLQLGLYRSVRYQDWIEPLIVVVGDEVNDFCFYFNLSRLRDRVVWMPPSLLHKLEDWTGPEQLSAADFCFSNEVKMAADYGQSEGGLRFVSISHNESTLRSIEANFSKCCVASIRRSSTVGGFTRDLIAEPLVAYEVDNFHKEVIVQTDEQGLMIGRLETPKPKHFSPINPTTHRWITQLRIPADQPATHFEMGQFIVLGYSATTFEVRVGRHGPAYFCPNTMYFGGDIDTIMVRPSIRIPDSMSTARFLANTVGYECKLSDKGIYTSRAIAAWGGIEHLSKFLADARGRALLNTFLLKTSSSDETGVYLNDRRRYVTLRSVTPIFGDDTPSIVDSLVHKGILHRGLIFQCELCRNSDWFSLAELDDSFVCKRCGTKQRFRQVHWKSPEEPMWFYKLDEIVYQGHKSNMHVTVLALTHLKKEAANSFSFCSDLEFTKVGTSRPEIEIDFFCVQDGMLTVGEAKKDEALAATAKEEREIIDGYINLVNTFNIRQIVFATFAETWSQSTEQAIRTRFSSVPVHLRLLSLKELAP